MAELVTTDDGEVKAKAKHYHQQGVCLWGPAQQNIHRSLQSSLLGRSKREQFSTAARKKVKWHLKQNKTKQSSPLPVRVLRTKQCQVRKRSEKRWAKEELRWRAQWKKCAGRDSSGEIGTRKRCEDRERWGRATILEGGCVCLFEKWKGINFESGTWKGKKKRSDECL